jgi:hypothetical protein
VLYFLFTSNMIPDGMLRPTFGDGRTPWFGRDTVTMPTLDNPMGNVLYTDYTDRPDRPAAAWYPSVKEEVSQAWDFIHPFEKKRDAERNFYTTASSVIPNDQSMFAQAAYGRPFEPQCRDTPGACDPEGNPNARFPERVQMRAGNGGGYGGGRGGGGY